ncbi:7TM diverse intracellular signaling domain-containing protein [Flavobacterium sp.]|uniref:7TM diverse intracellular signaling domain-containing protein n=1 Tax=Flavobacterium sp. TaxID=239 RepID=UPI00286AE03B|nr:7TM diverse intracellular signaling domain-containing protein [Flavobacterium sp.]
MKIIYFLSFLFLTNHSFSKNESDLLVDAKYAIDKNSSWQNNTAKQQPFLPFNTEQNLNIGYNKNATVWCLFKIKNLDTIHVKRTWLCFDNNHIDSLLIFDGNKQRILGDRTRFASLFIDSQSFEIVLNPNEKKTFLVKIKKEISFLEFTYKFKDEKELTQQSRIKIALISFFLGFLFLLLLFNTILLYITKKKLYAYYILYSVLSAIYIMISSNYAKHFLFTEFLYFSELRIYTASFWFISLSIFLTHFLDLKKLQPLKYKAIYVLNSTNFSIILLTIILLLLKQLNPLKLFLIFGYINFLIVIIVIIWATIIHLKFDRKSAIYVLISFFPQLVWGTAIILKSFQIIPKNLHEDWLVIISLYEVFLFGYLLTRNYLETFQKNKVLIEEITVEKEKSIQAITQVQIRERRNIANIIHDNFGSRIAYIMQLLELKKITTAQESIQELASDIREVSHQILPKSLDDGALISSLQSQITTLNTGLKHTKIEIFTYDFPEKIMEPWVYDVYLISLEIINNALKHGKSNYICIELFGYNNEYLLQYTDDGIGYDTKLIPKGFGLENIEKRVLHYKGTFEINSNKNQGTVVQISIPKK